jgi:cell division transport system ATP-binding protein
MIVFEHVGVVFSGNYQALTDVSLNIARGEFVYILGRSGAGKSTLLRLIYADVMPTRGIVKVAANDISFLPARRVPYLRRQVGVVFQDYMLLEDRTVFDNVRMALDIYFFRRSACRDRIWNLLKRLGIFELRDVPVRRLSGGEKQRVSIARAMVNDPQIILADEPTGNLDADNAMIIMQLLQQASQNGTTILMATHDMAMVEKYPARIIKLEGGKIC